MAAGRKVINIGLVGMGRIGQVHMQHLLNGKSNAQLKAVSDPDVSTKPKFTQKIRYYEDYSDMLQSEDLNAVIICTPTPLHFDMIEEAFSYGLHVFCEKPLDQYLDKIKKAHQFSLKSKLCLQVGFNRRFDPNFKNIFDQVQKGAIGDVHILKITSRDPSPPSLAYLKSSGGIFMDMTIHDFDMARYLVGSEVTKVFAQGGVLVDEAFNEANDIDTAIIQLQFENGSLGVIDNSRQAIYGYDQRVEVFGSKGMLQANNNSPFNTIFHRAEGSQNPKPYDFFMDRYKDSFRYEIDAFINSILNSTLPEVTASDAYKATALAIAAKESLLTNRPVTIRPI
jgi:myo-inositol 2-dehydrogenase/D-chiro-inositol 1-dehydrogenase